MSELTELQKDLPISMLDRDLQRIQNSLYGCFDRGLVYEIDKRVKWYEEIVVADVACGIGAAIEEIVRTLPREIGEEHFMRVNIRGIGIDINPLPEMIPLEILRINPSTEQQEEGEQTKPLAEFRKDDARTLETIQSDSVDVLYSVSGLHYVDDTLRALEAGYRVLKEGGIMGHEIPDFLVSKPDIHTIIRETPGAEKVFHIRQRPSENDYECNYGFIVGKKEPGNTFKGFPWRMTGVNHPYEHLDGFKKHVVVGNYVKVSETR